MMLLIRWVYFRCRVQTGEFICMDEVTARLAENYIFLFVVTSISSQKILQNIADKDLANDKFPFSTSKLIRANGNYVRAFRISFVGELGYELHIPIQSCEKVYRGIIESGKLWNLKLAGYRALYSLSCEKGKS